MSFGTPKFDAAVAEIKALCGPTHTQLFRFGQFYVTRRTLDDLLAQITSELRGNLRLALQPDQLANAIAFFKAKLEVAAPDIDRKKILDMLGLIERDGDMAGIRAMFTPTALDSANARAEFNAVWTTTHITAAPLLSSSPASLGKAQAAFAFESDRCHQVLRAFAAKLLKARGIGVLPRTVELSAGDLAGQLPQQVSPAGAGDITARQTIVYTRPDVLAAATARMRAALEKKGYVHCGVLSGAMHEHSKFPNPEHHILVIEHDTIDGQKAFLFWDPDAAHSNIASTGWGNGFGVLFSRDGRLCTGVDDADLADIDRLGLPTNKTFGDHLRDTRRHCYQVYTVQTLPMRAALKLHVKVLSPPAHADVDDMLGRAREVFAASGLDLIELSRETVSPGTDLDRFQTLFVGDGADDEPTPELVDLHATLRDARDFGVGADPAEAVIAFVDTLVPAQRGCARHPLEQPGAVVSAALATPWTLAYEIGRILGLGASIAPGDLTFRSTAAIDDEAPPTLSDDNVESLLSSPLVEA